MKRPFALAAFTLLLSACRGDPTPTGLGERTVALGLDRSTTVQVPFQGTWRFSDIPTWVKLSRSEGSGNILITVTAERAGATPPRADLPKLQGTVKVKWENPAGHTSGTALWRIEADQYQLTGQVSATQSLGSADIQKSSIKPLGTTQQRPQGIIVTYRSQGLRDALAFPDGSMTAQSLSNRQLAAQSNHYLSQSGLAQASRSPLNDRSLVIDVPATASTLEALKRDPNVESVSANARMHALNLGTSSTPNLVQPLLPTDHYAPLQFAYTMLGYPAVWRDMEAGGYTKPITVAVVDSGVRYDHPDLAGKLWKPGEGALDVIEDVQNGDGDGADEDPTDPSVAGRTTGSHGTHVTGIIVGGWGTFAAPCPSCSTSGIVGASYKAPIKVLPIRALDTQGDTSVKDVSNAVRYAAGLPVTLGGKTWVNPHPAPVINLSLGGILSAEESEPLCTAMSEARAAGSLIFAAAGNEGLKDPYHPAACAAVVAVGSVTVSELGAPGHAWYSNTYDKVELTAPGGSGGLSFYNGQQLNGEPFPDDILSTSWDYQKNQPNYEIESGTSQAVPQVSALAALLLSKGVTLNADDTLTRLIATATDLGPAGRDAAFGHGMINAAAAVGAPAISNSFGLNIQDTQGRSYQPPLDLLGRFTAYLADETYRLTLGRDYNGNGLFGESGEPHVVRSVTLGPSTPKVDLGLLKME